MPTKHLAGFTPEAVAVKYGFRSGLEKKVADFLREHKVEFSYECDKIHYKVPESDHVYTPDFRVKTRSGKLILIETKGRFLLEDRKKHLLIRAQYPNLDIRLVFQNPNAKLDKRSKTTYCMWAEKHGFQWAGKCIPEEWLNE